MKKALLLLICSLLLSVSTSYGQQDPLYTQYFFNPASINPAYAGTHNIFSLNMTSRKQWLGLGGSPVTNTFTAHTSLLSDKMAVGVLAMNDFIGISRNTEATIMYSYKIAISGENKLSFGLQGTFANYGYNYNHLELLDFNDPSFESDGTSANAPNFGAGIYYNSEFAFLGLSVPKILKMDFSDGVNDVSKYEPHYYLFGGFLFDINYALKFRGSTLVRYVNGGSPSVDLNGSILMNEVVWIGASIRNLNTLSFMAELQISDVFRIGYAVDLATTDIIRKSLGSHEIVLNIDFSAFSFQTVIPRYF